MRLCTRNHGGRIVLTFSVCFVSDQAVLLSVDRLTFLLVVGSIIPAVQKIQMTECFKQTKLSG